MLKTGHFKTRPSSQFNASPKPQVRNLNGETIMARPRKPTNVLEMSGAFRKNPKRQVERGNEPEPLSPLGPPPAHLSDDECKLWDELVSISAPGVLGNTDRWAVEVAVSLMHQFRRDKNEIVGGEHGLDFRPLFSDARLSRLQAILGQLGMTPADRSKVKVPQKGKPSNPFGEI